MTRRSSWVPGDWAAVCDVCGFEYMASELKRRWDGLMVCEPDFEQRHPSDFIRAREDKQSVPWTRSPPEDTFVEVDYVDSTVGTQDTSVPPGTFNGETL